MNVSPIHELLSRLQGVREVKPGQWMALCPVHDDHHPSLSISEKPDGVVLIKDWAGCETIDVLRFIGLEFRDLFPHGGSRSHGPLSKYQRNGIAQWRAALNVACWELLVIEIAAHDLSSGKALDEADYQRLLVACDYVHRVREVLA